MQSASNAPPTPSTSASSGYCSAMPRVPTISSGFRPDADGERQDERPQDEAAGNDRRLRQQRDGNGDAGPQQEDEEEDAAGALGQSLDAGMHVDAIDRVVAQECH